MEQARLNVMAWTVVMTMWALSKVATVMATVVVATVMPSGGGVAPLTIVLSFVDRRGPNP